MFAVTSKKPSKITILRKLIQAQECKLETDLNLRLTLAKKNGYHLQY